MKQDDFDLFAGDFDPFTFSEDASAKTKAKKGFGASKGKSVEDALLGPNPETDRGAAAALQSKQKLNKPKDNIPRLIKLANSLGYFAIRMEHYEAQPQFGRGFRGDPIIVKKDFCGVLDILGFKPFGSATALLGIQDTTEASVGEHVRKMASNKTVRIPGVGDRTYFEVTSELLRANFRIVIVGWRWEQGKWSYVTKDVTMKDLEAAAARRRK